jgi:hypothetical protein
MVRGDGELGIMTLLNANTMPDRMTDMSFYIIGNYVLLYKKPPVEHTAAYNVDVANCDRRRRESKAFVKRNSIVL